MRHLIPAAYLNRHLVSVIDALAEFDRVGATKVCEALCVEALGLWNNFVEVTGRAFHLGHTASTCLLV